MRVLIEDEEMTPECDNGIFLHPSDISNKWISRFEILEFTFDIDGCLYSPKKWDDNWEPQIKALWLRSVGVSPERIAKRLNVKLTTVKNRWIDNITLHYKLKHTINTDWSDIGYVDKTRARYISYGGATWRPELETGQSEMDGELVQIRHDYRDTLDESSTLSEANPSHDLYREYYGDYEE
jgi:hypothetical protein